MDDLDAELLANQLIDSVLRECQERKITLTEHSVRLLRVLAEALIKEPPISSIKRFQTDEYGPGRDFWFETGRKIFSSALEDRRIEREMRSRERVSFSTLMRVLSDSGYTMLQNTGFKG